MEREFIQYTEAIALKELGFDEKCLGYYIKNSSLWCNWLDVKFNDDPSNDKEDFVADAPLKSQAFRWFREKYKLASAILPFQDIEDRTGLCYYYSIVDLDEYKDEDILCNESNLGASDVNFSSHPEAELACLKKLIEIVKKK